MRLQPRGRERLHKGGLSPLEGLRSTLFEEMKARILETDMSVASRRAMVVLRAHRGGEEIRHPCRRPAGEAEELRRRESPGDEQILLDENVLAEGHEYFAVGTAVVSPDHKMLAYGTDTAGDERYELRFRSLDERPSDHRARNGGRHRLRPGLVQWHPTWPSTSASTRPCGPTSCGATNSGPTPPRRLVSRRLIGVSRWDRTTRTAFVLVALHSTNTAEWLAIPADEPTPAPRVDHPRQRGPRVRRRPPTPPGDGERDGSSWSPTRARRTSGSRRCR